MARRALWAVLCAALASSAGGAARAAGGLAASVWTPAAAAATAAKAAAAGTANTASGSVSNAYQQMARKAERAYEKKQDTVMGLLYVDISENTGDPLAVCNDGSQGELPSFP